jgi:hypothetical protein
MGSVVDACTFDDCPEERKVMAQQGIQERRKHPRFAVSLNVSLSFSGGGKESPDDRKISGKARNISGMTGDISFEGLLVKANPHHEDVSAFFTDNRADSPSFPVDLEIELDGKTIRSAGQIRWFKLWYTGQEPYQFEAGVFLRRMGPESRLSWDEYFKKLSS